MIAKELDPFTATNRFEKAGREAEEQMAFYLKRAFEREEMLHIINYLRIEKGGDVAQIDHLIIHPFGLIIIESKSVTTQVGINEHGEWHRVYNGNKQGMPSPVLQAQRQGQFLVSLLNDYAASLLDLSQKKSMKVDLLVAISDSGIIDRAPGVDIPQVAKADQVPARIVDIVKHRSAVLQQGIVRMSNDELQNISKFLISRHQPLKQSMPPKFSKNNIEITLSEKSTTPYAIVQPSQHLVRESSSPKDEVDIVLTEKTHAPHGKTMTSHTCRHCGSPDVFIKYGQYGYYFKCRKCDGNTNIKAFCPKCKTEYKLKKDGAMFYAECKGCGGGRHFFTNPAGV